MRSDPVAGRPRTISDAHLLRAVAAAIGAVGPAKLTLADVARHAGVSTGALVQRFGSKRELLLAFLRAETLPTGGMRAAYDAAPDPLTGLIDAVLAFAGREQSPEEFANHLAFLHLELADPEFRALLGAYDAALRAELTGYLTGAVAAGQLGRDHVEPLAAAVSALVSGTQIVWAMSRRGTLADALRRDLATLLAPYANGGHP
jgi:AcrR family transcriptional regulator